MPDSYARCAWLLALALLAPLTPAFAGADLVFNDTQKTAELRAQFILYGYEFELPTGIRDRVHSELSKLYNGEGLVPGDEILPLTVRHRDQTYRVHPHFETRWVSPAEAEKLALQNQEASTNFFRIFEGSPDRNKPSFVVGLGANCGVLYLSDEVGNSTASHEFGHTLGWQHPSPESGRPQIMVPAGSRVDAPFALQNQMPHQILNQIYRRVFQKNYDQLRWTPHPSDPSRLVIGKSVSANTRTCLFTGREYPKNPLIQDAVVFPNPTLAASSNELKIRLTALEAVTIRIQLVDTLGRGRFEKSVSLSKGSQILSIGTPQLDRGLHLLMLRTVDFESPPIVIKLLSQ